jgi:hypothetical protein
MAVLTRAGRSAFYDVGFGVAFPVFLVTSLIRPTTHFFYR